MWRHLQRGLNCTERTMKMSVVLRQWYAVCSWQLTFILYPLYPRRCYIHAVVISTPLLYPHCYIHAVVISTPLLYPRRCYIHTVISMPLLYPRRCYIHAVVISTLLYPHCYIHAAENKLKKDMIQLLVRRGYDADPVKTWHVAQNKDEVTLPSLEPYT